MVFEEFKNLIWVDVEVDKRRRSDTVGVFMFQQVWGSIVKLDWIALLDRIERRLQQKHSAGYTLWKYAPAKKKHARKRKYSC